MAHLPIRPMQRPSILSGQVNGKLDVSVLQRTPGIGNTPDVILCKTAARCWRALAFNADIAGHTLAISHAPNAYRPYFIQERIFLQRYTTIPNGDRPRTWQGKKWYKKPGVAAAAVPGTSNHGWGLAIDLGEYTPEGVHSLDQATLEYLVSTAHIYGWSWELESEPWHVRCVVGDFIPPAVLRHEADQVGVELPEEAESGMDIINDPEAERMWAQWELDGTTIVREYSNYRGKDVGKVLPGVAYVIDEQVKAGKIKKA